MIVKLLSSMAGDRFSFPAGAIIKCSDVTGGRLIEGGLAKEADSRAEVEGELFDEHPDAMAAAGREPETPESRKPAPETPESRPGGRCQGTTKAGNPCARAALAGSAFCDSHQQ